MPRAINKDIRNHQFKPPKCVPDEYFHESLEIQKPISLFDFQPIKSMLTSVQKIWKIMELIKLIKLSSKFCSDSPLQYFINLVKHCKWLCLVNLNFWNQSNHLFLVIYYILNSGSKVCNSIIVIENHYWCLLWNFWHTSTTASKGAALIKLILFKSWNHHSSVSI